MFFINYLLALALFVIIFLATRLVLFWRKKKAIWPLTNINLLIRAITYSGLTLLLLGILHIVFKKINIINLLWLDASIYIFLAIIKPEQIFNLIKNKEKYVPKKNHFLGGAFFVFILLECFVFNAKGYSANKETYTYQNYISEGITTDGEIKNNKIILKNKQCIYIDTNKKDYENLYLHFNTEDMNLYVNIHEKKVDASEYTFKKYVLIDPSIDAYGYISLDHMDDVSSLKIEFDIDDTRYLNDSTKPLITIDKISFDAYFPLIINPLRLGGILGLLLIGFNFVKLFVKNELKEELTTYQKLERVVLFGGIIIFVYFFIISLINHTTYFIKYDELYLGGTSSNNIYYQQLDAYIKGQLHIDAPVDSNLAALSNPYDPANRNGMTYLWDHAFYNGKYYCYYGHAPIYLVMLPIYWISKYVPSNLFVLQLGTLFSIFAYLLAALQIIKLFIKKANTSSIVLTLVAMVFGSLLLCNNTYEYGGMTYRIPYAYANGFLFLTIYLFIRGYKADKYRFLYFVFTALSLVFIILSRPLEAIYLILFLPLIIKMLIKEFKNNKKGMILNYVPALSILLIGAIIVCVMNYTRFGSILEFGEHYQLTVTDCTKNHLSIDGVLPTIYHYFIQPPQYVKESGMLSYTYHQEGFDIHPYVTGSIGLAFIPVSLLMVLVPFVIKKDDDLSFIIFAIASPIVVFFVAFVNYCFAGVCPRYMNDFLPWASIAGGLMGLKAIERSENKYKAVQPIISIVLFISIFLTGQYHFQEFDGLRIGDFHGLLGIIKTITNRYNI